MQRRVSALPGNDDLAKSLAQGCCAEIGAVEFERVPYGEIYIGLTSRATGRRVVTCSTIDCSSDAIDLVPLLTNEIAAFLE